MLTFTRHQCRVTAFALLALFVSALGLLGVCAVWCGPMHGAGAGLAVATAAQGGIDKGAHGCCAKKKAVATSKQSKKAECCTHEKAAKWSSVPDESLAKLLHDGAPALDLPPGALRWQSAPWAGAWDCTLAVQLVPPRHLPPKIPDIRVFLRSLIV